MLINNDINAQFINKQILVIIYEFEKRKDLNNFEFLF